MAAADLFAIAVADCVCIAFFFLLRPGEHTGTRSESTPFTLADAQMFHGPVRLDLQTATDTALLGATFASLTFTTQKNSVRGEVVGLAHSGNPQFSPTLAIARRVTHLRDHNAPPTTPLASVWNNESQSFKPISSPDIAAALRLATLTLGPLFGFQAADISAWSLRASGTMVLLCAQVDSDIIRLLGCWRSNEMLRYLTVSAEPVMRNFASRMLQNGSFSLHPNETVPML